MARHRHSAQLGRGGLRDLAARYLKIIEIETVDVTVPTQIAALHDRLAPGTFDLLFVNAGVANQPATTVGATSTDEFVRVMVTNASDRCESSRHSMTS